ncbi:MAG: CoA transferase [Acidimicrobiales bacterium]
MTSTGMLSPYRVLDLTDDRGHLAGMLFAQLGAEVILVEPPGGNRSRRAADPGHEVYDRGKASVVLEDPTLLDRLAAGADILIECGALPVDLDALRAANPALITASITPFGQDGPKASWAATDLIVAAASGTMSVTGDADRAPVRVSEPMTWHYAAADAVCGALIALHERHRSGLGQHVDVSAQQSFLTATQFTMMNALVGNASPHRTAGGVQLGPLRVQFVYDCADGHVTVTFLFGPMIGRYTERLWRWIQEEGRCGPELGEKNWIDFAMNVFNGVESPDALDRATEVLAAFLRTKTKAELFEAALGRNLLIAPVTTTRDVLEMEQLATRDYWDHLDGRRMVGPFLRADAAPLRRLEERPAELGADTERYGAEGVRRPAVGDGPAAFEPPDGDLRPLARLKVLDFMWALAGPGGSHALADSGATVVRVESQSRPDVLRAVNPFRGRRAIKRLVPVALPQRRQVRAVSSTSTPRPPVRWCWTWCAGPTWSPSPSRRGPWRRGGFDEGTLLAVSPRLVFFSSSLMGQSGPCATTPASAPWPQPSPASTRSPAGPIAYRPVRSPPSPTTSPRFTVAAVLSALDHRRRSGHGLRLDFAQLEGSLHLLGRALWVDELTGASASRSGNEDPVMAPHNVYPAAGEDRWLAVAVETDAQWRALAAVLERPDLAGLTAEQRRARRPELDDVVARWATHLEPGAAQDVLQAAGVPAHQVQDSAACVADPQFVHRRMFPEVPHASYGTTWVEVARSRCRAPTGRCAGVGPRSTSTSRRCWAICWATTPTASPSWSSPAPWSDSGTGRPRRARGRPVPMVERRGPPSSSAHVEAVQVHHLAERIGEARRNRASPSAEP